jgi:hypothetical protein
VPLDLPCTGAGHLEILDTGGRLVEVDLDQKPAEDEVLVFTAGGGGFVVKGSVEEVSKSLAESEWSTFELAESGDPIMLRSSQVVAMRGGESKHRRGAIGFVHRD